MKILKLNASHSDQVKKLYEHFKYMGVDIVGNFSHTIEWHKNYMFTTFYRTYLVGLSNFHAYGAFDSDNQLTSIICLFDSTDEPSWYYTLCRSNGDTNALKELFDAVIAIQEKKNRFKFYTLVNVKHGPLLRKFTYSEFNNERYGYFDEFVVPAKSRCYYNNAWELLFKKVLLPTDTVVRCSYLKQEYRPAEPPIGGGI